MGRPPRPEPAMAVPTMPPESDPMDGRSARRRQRPSGKAPFPAGFLQAIRPRGARGAVSSGVPRLSCSPTESSSGCPCISGPDRGPPAQDPGRGAGGRRRERGRGGGASLGPEANGPTLPSAHSPRETRFRLELRFHGGEEFPNERLRVFASEDGGPVEDAFPARAPLESPKARLRPHQNRLNPVGAPTRPTGRPARATCASVPSW